MTTTKLSGRSKKLTIILTLAILSQFLFAAQNTAIRNWTLAAQKFTFSSGHEQSSVTDGITEMFPSRILEYVGRTLVRDIYPNEVLERKLAELKKERISLCLQLSAEYKKRDSLILYNYTKGQMKAKLKESEKSITSINKKIKRNLEQEKTEYAKAEENTKRIENGDFISDSSSDWKKLGAFLKSFFKSEDKLITQEKITFYKDDISELFKPSENASEQGYSSYDFEKEVTNAGINSLMTGQINLYGDYVYLSVDLYLYPGAKKLATITEVGSMSDQEFLCSSIARQLSPFIANSLPVEVFIKVNPEDVVNKTSMFIDDVEFSEIPPYIIIQSGVHTLQFVSDGYDKTVTTYYFEGNQKYDVEVLMEKENIGFLNIAVDSPKEGTMIANGLIPEVQIGNVSKIKINGQTVLGEITAADGTTDFFYIPEELVADGNNLKVKQNPIDNSEYIDKRRKMMYTGYSLFVASLIPAFISYGTFTNELNRYNNGSGDYDSAKNLQTLSQVAAGISIGCAAFWIYELVRYLVAANSVLPEKVKVADSPVNLMELAEQNAENGENQNSDSEVIDVSED